MLSKTLRSALRLAAFSTPALAEEPTAYAAALQQQIIDHLQSKLPDMRSAYGLTQKAAIITPEEQDKRSWLSRIAVDGITKYPGRIVWL